MLGYLLTHPEALTAVKTEMEASQLSPLDSSSVTPVFGEGFKSRIVLAETITVLIEGSVCCQGVHRKTLKIIYQFNKS